MRKETAPPVKGARRVPVRPAEGPEDVAARRGGNQFFVANMPLASDGRRRSKTRASYQVQLGRAKTVSWPPRLV